jgi:N-acetylglucosaminyl-diphospho-decaprenol L-rhamnosyltransferase
VDDLAVIVVSANSAHWLRPCLRTVFDRAGAVGLDVVVADNESTDGTRELVEREFPQARVVACQNLGFGYGNNRALMTCDARYVLFLNPDTEILDGTLSETIAALDERPEIGLVGVRQVTSDGRLYPTIRWFPNAIRALGDAVGLERAPFRARWMGERELRSHLYADERDSDWTSGSFMLARREALEAAGFFDERFFLYSEETDLCYRIKQAGWEIRHLPSMTILHHADKEGSPKMEAQNAYSRLQYARKHFSPAHRPAYAGALTLGYVLRYLAPGNRQRREASRLALRVIFGRDAPPFGPPPRRAVAPRETDRVSSSSGRPQSR